jgi:membrane protein implicated in regulation of membrane protease activity
VRLWFWGWLTTAAAIALVSALRRDRSTAPFAAGAACAAAAEAAGVTPSAQWIAFVGISAVLFVAVNFKHYRSRHASHGRGQHHLRAPEDGS